MKGMSSLAVLLVAASPVAAAAPVPPGPAAATSADPAALAAARRLIAAADMQKQVGALVPQIVDAAMTQARGTFKANAMPDELQARLQAAMRDEMPGLMDVFTPAVQEQMALAYAHNFSAADLNHLADMMGDPAMVRFRDRTPAVMKELLPELMTAMAPKQQAFQKRIAGIVADWLRDHPADKSRLARPVAS